jgi:hypothetical protein
MGESCLEDQLLDKLQRDFDSRVYGQKSVSSAFPCGL